MQSQVQQASDPRADNRNTVHDYDYFQLATDTLTHPLASPSPLSRHDPGAAIHPSLLCFAPPPLAPPPFPPTNSKTVQACARRLFYAPTPVHFSFFSPTLTHADILTHPHTHSPQPTIRPARKGNSTSKNQAIQAPPDHRRHSPVPQSPFSIRRPMPTNIDFGPGRATPNTTNHTHPIPYYSSITP